MWSECVGVCQLLNWKMHGETLKGDLRVFLLLFQGRYGLYVKTVLLRIGIHFHKAFIHLAFLWYPETKSGIESAKPCMEEQRHTEGYNTQKTYKEWNTKRMIHT